MESKWNFYKQQDRNKYTVKINQPCFHWKQDKGMGQVGEMQGTNMTDLSAMVRKEVNTPPQRFLPSIDAQ